jgi:hypothetical protein
MSSISEDSNNICEDHASNVFRSFTTERKTSINIARKGSIVKERCRQLSEIALDLSSDRKISEEDLAYLVERYIGADKETKRAYLGYYGRIRRTRSGEGYVVGQSRTGYLEKFDFMHRAGRTWIIHAQVKLPTGPVPYQNSEEVQSKSIEKIYLSSSLGVVSNRETEENIETGRKKEEEYREIEKFYSKDFPKIPELTPEEKLILITKPTDKKEENAT